MHSSTDFVATSNGQVIKDLIINGKIDTAGYDDILIENVT